MQTVYEAMEEREPMSRRQIERACANHGVEVSEFDAFQREQGTDRTDADFVFGAFLGY